MQWFLYGLSGTVVLFVTLIIWPRVRSRVKLPEGGWRTTLNIAGLILLILFWSSINGPVAGWIADTEVARALALAPSFIEQWLWLGVVLLGLATLPFFASKWLKEKEGAVGWYTLLFIIGGAMLWVVSDLHHDQSECTPTTGILMVTDVTPTRTVTLCQEKEKAILIMHEGALQSIFVRVTKVVQADGTVLLGTQAEAVLSVMSQVCELRIDRRLGGIIGGGGICAIPQNQNLSNQGTAVLTIKPATADALGITELGLEVIGGY